ncbi:MAG: hypothetical protein ACR2PS_08605 [Pseudomonadales bacterium]
MSEKKIIRLSDGTKFIREQIRNIIGPDHTLSTSESHTTPSQVTDREIDAAMKLFDRKLRTKGQKKWVKVVLVTTRYVSGKYPLALDVHPLSIFALCLISGGLAKGFLHSHLEGLHVSFATVTDTEPLTIGQLNMRKRAVGIKSARKTTTVGRKGENSGYYQYVDITEEQLMDLIGKASQSKTT